MKNNTEKNNNLYFIRVALLLSILSVLTLPQTLAYLGDCLELLSTSKLLIVTTDYSNLSPWIQHMLDSECDEDYCADKEFSFKRSMTKNIERRCVSQKIVFNEKPIWQKTDASVLIHLLVCEFLDNVHSFTKILDKRNLDREVGESTFSDVQVRIFLHLSNHEVLILNEKFPLDAKTEKEFGFMYCQLEYMSHDPRLKGVTLQKIQIYLDFYEV